MIIDYLHKAVLIVFVLNVAKAGGIQQDRVLKFSYSFTIQCYALLYTITDPPNYQACKIIVNHDAMFYPR